MAKQNLEDFMDIQISRFQVLKNLNITRTSFGQANTFLDTCSYCIARCILLDILSFQKIKKFDNNKIKAFYTKYHETRNEQAHFFETPVKTVDLPLTELEEVLKEIYSELHNAEVIVLEDDTLSKLLVETFKRFNPSNGGLT